MIVGYDRERRNDLEAALRSCMGEDSSVDIHKYDIREEYGLLKRPDVPAAVFIIIDSVTVLSLVESIAGWGAGYPVVMVATHPQYAIEGIRQKVKHYILFPLEREEIREALNRTGVIAY